ncbi:MAG TPA: acyltransferase family protein [Acidimicrobiia bacterium]|nr:acyltransferase family protein [Acidimicrobiia bacterium]
MDEARDHAPADQPRAPALDGLRALAVLAVLAFHGGLPVGKGGFLGVSLFFTLSGFLITRLLIGERARRGRIRLRDFWERRLRRLAPASLVTLAGIAIAAPHFVDPSARSALRGDILACVGYVANWRFLLQGHQYADLFRAPSPVLHFWSLAIEEQFYVVFPLVVAITLRLSGGSRRALAITLGTLCGASVIAQLVLRDVDRVYLGSDTRAAELLAGALLALALAARPPTSARTRVAIASASSVALVIFGILVATVSVRSPFLGDGGLALVAVLNVALVSAAVANVGPVSMLGWGPIAAVGRVSYGLYLVHWPVFVWLNERRTGLHGLELAIARLTIAGAITVVSYHFLECPIRYKRVLRGRPRFVPAFAAGVAFAVAAVAVLPTGHIEPLMDPSVLAAVKPPLPPPVVPLRVMLVGNATGSKVARALRHDRTHFVVDDETRAGCTLVLPPFAAAVQLRVPGPPSTCGDWISAWRVRAKRFHPDVIVVFEPEQDLALQTAVTEPARLTAIHILQAVRGTYEVASRILRDTGAVVAWSDPTDAQLGRLPGGTDPNSRHAFRLVLDSSMMLVTAPLLGVVAFDENVLARSNAAIGNEIWRTYRAGRAEQGLKAKGQQGARAVRVMFAGDSTSLNLASGVAAYGRDHGTIAVDWAGQIGCPIARVQRVREAGDTAAFVPDCKAFPELWPEHIKAFHPDLIVVVTTFMDGADVQRFGSGTWEHLGEPPYDAFFSSELRAAVAIAKQYHVRLAWATAPVEDAFVPGGTSALRARLQDLDARLADLAAQDHAVRLVPLAARVDRPGGVIDYKARPDGVHFTLAAARIIADQWLGREVIALARGSAR